LSFRTNPPSGGEVRNRDRLEVEPGAANLQLEQTVSWHKKKYVLSA
jgi:hypothetical protein